jgi:septal ring factor EnvC (AmiA/AmiB activator)
MAKILLGIKTKSASYSSNDSYGFSCGTIEASQVDIVMSGTETEIRKFVTETREARKQLPKLSDEIERLEEMQCWNDIDAVRETYDRLDELTKRVNYNKLIMVDGVEL